MIATVFDTETTALIKNHTIPLAKQPEIIEFYGITADLASGEIIRDYYTLIKPKRDISEETIRITGITPEMVADASSFESVADDIQTFIADGGKPIAHNASFDKEMVEIEFERLDKLFTWPRKPLCTVEATIHLKGYRLSLTGLHELLFSEPFPEAHRAKSDVAALLRCCVELFKRGEL